MHTVGGGDGEQCCRNVGWVTVSRSWVRGARCGEDGPEVLLPDQVFLVVLVGWQWRLYLCLDLRFGGLLVIVLS